MSGAAHVDFTVTNLTNSVGTPLQGISYVQGRSIRGPFNSPNEIFNSWSQFVSKHGGLSSVSKAPLIIKRLLEKGGSIRFNRIGHYVTITDRESLTATKATQPEVSILTFDASFVVGNVIDITINGDDLDSINYTLSNDNTLDEIANALQGSNDVLSAVVIENTETNGSNHSIAITPKPGSTIDLESVTVTGGLTQPIDSVTESTSISTSNAQELFELVPKYQGADYNNLIVTITGGSNGQPGYFNINITHKIEPTISENYVNLIINNNTSASTSKYLDKLVSDSKFIDVIYKDLQTYQGQLTPSPVAFQFQGGTDGEALEDSDYIGDSNSRVGFYAFDEYDDSYQITTLDSDSIAVHLAGASYASNRKDLVYFPFVTNTDKVGILNTRTSLGDNKYQYIFGGYVKVTDPITNQLIEINPVGDIFALIASSDKDFGEWYSFAGPNRGLISGVLGVNPNFGAPASFRDLDELANKQVNMVVNKNGSVKLWGNFTGQYANNQERFMNILRLIMFLKKSLRPSLEYYLEEPNDIPTWKRMFYTVKPFLDSLVTNRAIYSYEWQGDQNASNLNNLQVNNATDVGNGKYKVNFMIKAIASLQEININIILAPTGVEFELVSELI